MRKAGLFVSLTMSPVAGRVATSNRKPKVLDHDRACMPIVYYGRAGRLGVLSKRPCERWSERGARWRIQRQDADWSSEGRLMAGDKRSTSVVIALVICVTLGAVVLRALELRLVPGKPNFQGSTLLMAEQPMRVQDVEIAYVSANGAALALDAEGLRHPRGVR